MPTLIGPPLRPTAHAEWQGQVPPEVEPGRAPDQVQPIRGSWIDGDIEIYRHDALQWQFIARVRSIRLSLHDTDIRWDWTVRAGTTEQQARTDTPVLFASFATPPAIRELSVTVTVAPVFRFVGEVGHVRDDEVVLIDPKSRVALTPPARDLFVNYETDHGPYRFLVRGSRPPEQIPLPAFDRCGRFGFMTGAGPTTFGIAYVEGATRHVAIVLVPAQRDGYPGAITFTFGDNSCEYGAPRIPATLNGKLLPEHRALPVIGTDHRYEQPGDKDVVVYLATGAGPLAIAEVRFRVR